MSRRHGVVTVLSLAFAAACADVTDPTVVPFQPEFAVVSMGGKVVLPSGQNVCNRMAAGTTYSIRFIRVVPDGADINVGVSNTMTCPNNTWTAPSGLEQGQYIARITSDATNGVATSPFPRIAFDTFTVSSATATENIVMPQGQSVGGGVTLDGVPYHGSGINFRPEITDVTGFNFSSLGSSDSAGGFGEFLGSSYRYPALLQIGQPYTAACTGGIGGARLVSSSPSPFVFGDTRTFECRFRTSAASRWTHRENELALTAGPGIFGSQAEADGSYGYGVQFPVADGELSRNLHSAVQHMFEGGFAILANNAVLTTPDVTGALQCGASCRDFFPVGNARVIDGVENPGIEVNWVMSDSASAESQNIDLIQRSFDGAGGAYVLFRLTIRNNNLETEGVRVGFFADWDVAGEFQGQSTALDGNIAYATKAGGPFVGSLFIGEYVARGYYGHANEGGGGVVPLTTQIDVLTGDVVNAGASDTDVWYMHSAGPVRIGAGRTKIVWFAIVAGETLAEMEANAALAEADVAARMGS